MLPRVKAPSWSWNAPTRSHAVGAMRNIAAKTKNGATPSQAARSGAGTRREGVGAAVMAVRLSCDGFEPHPQDSRLRAVGERGAPRYFATVAPTTASHCLAMTSLAAFC